MVELVETLNYGTPLNAGSPSLSMKHIRHAAGIERGVDNEHGC